MNQPDIKKNIKLGLIKCADAMVMGAKNMKRAKELAEKLPEANVIQKSFFNF